MSGSRMGTARELARIMEGGAFAGHPDRSLLARFADQGDAAAFEALLLRHGPKVLNICRRLLPDRHEAEDAFQATFLVLVKGARSLSLGGDGSLSPWISTVAYRVAQRARARRIRRLARERSIDAMPAAVEVNADRGSSPSLEEAATAIHEELALLPDRLRAAIVCCYLDGLTHEAAAARLSWPVGTVRSRLARARARLRERLARRGFAPGDADLTLLLARPLDLSMPARLLRSTVSLVQESVSSAGAAAASAVVLDLVEGVLMPMMIRKTALAASLIVPIGALILAGFTFGFPQERKAPAPGPSSSRAVAKAPPEEEATVYPMTYYVGDLLVTPALLPNGEANPGIDMGPIMEMITTTVAPGTWRVMDHRGHEITRGEDPSRSEEKQGKASGRPLGSIVPFYLSISLIINHTDEVHTQIKALLICLREYRRYMGWDAPASPLSVPLSDIQKQQIAILKQRLEDARHALDAVEKAGAQPTP